MPKAALLAAFYLSYTGGAAQPVVISYGHEITQWNANLRQLLVATGNIFTYTFSAWMPGRLSLSHAFVSKHMLISEPSGIIPNI